MKAVWGTIGCLQRVAAARARGRCFGSGTTPKDTMLKENKGETTPTKDTMLKETKETMLKDTKETKDTITRILPPGIKRPVYTAPNTEQTTQTEDCCPASQHLKQTSPI